MRIGELSERTGLSPKALRFYESRGLLPAPVRTASGYRDYPPEAAERLRFVREAQTAGLTLAEIASVLDLKNSGVGACEHTTALLRRHLDELDARIDALRTTRVHLRELAARSAGLDPSNCTDPNRCQVIEAST